MKSPIKYLSFSNYCKKYSISRSKLLKELHEGHIHAIRYSTGWVISDEPIQDGTQLDFHAAYISSTPYGNEFYSYEQDDSYDGACYMCREMGWVFDSDCHGWTDSYQMVVYIGKLD